MAINGWQRLGLELTKRPYSPKQTSFVPRINQSLRIAAEELKNKLDSVALLDARSPQEHIAGHLPKAILSPFTDGVGLDGMLFKDKESLLKQFEEKQISKDKEIVCYCTHGPRAANLCYQLKMAGCDKVKLYDGSFIDWYGRRFPLE